MSEESTGYYCYYNFVIAIVFCNEGDAMFDMFDRCNKCGTDFFTAFSNWFLLIFDNQIAFEILRYWLTKFNCLDRKLRTIKEKRKKLQHNLFYSNI